MKKYKLLYLLLGVILLGASCTVNRKAVPLAPVSAQLNITMSDLEYVGEVEGKAVQSTVLWLPVGGRRYHYGVTTLTGHSINLPNRILGSRGMSNALYDALMQKPDADFVIPFAVETKKNVMFLGSKTTYNVKAKAFKIRAR